MTDKPAVISREELEQALADGRCPDCRDAWWRLGPRGGAARNIECKRCKSRFNVTRFMGQLIFAQRIPSEADGGSHWREDMFPQ